MPIYEYRCEACGHEMDHFHRTRSEPKPRCEACGEDALERLVSLSAFHLKGSGWYATDYKSDKKQTNDGQLSANRAASGATEGGSETKAPESTATTTTSKENTAASAPSAEASASTKSKDAA